MTNDPLAVLDALSAAVEAATPGPWFAKFGHITQAGDRFNDPRVGVAGDADGEAIVALRNAFPAVLAVARAAVSVDNRYGEAMAHDPCFQALSQALARLAETEEAG